LRGHRRAFGVQRVEDRLDQQEIDPARDQRIALLAIIGLQRVEIDLAIARIVDIGRQRQRLVGRADRTGDKAALGRPFASALSAQARASFALSTLICRTRCSQP
jgi:hypothetical protein